MRRTSSEPAPDMALSAGQVLHGFEVEHAEPLDEMRAAGYLLVHQKSGARVLHVHSADPENLLAIGLRTPPPDDTGLPHILEHTVLCGSQRYPVKDPLVELLKTSLATFLNAMTYPDKTVYPCASMVARDFYNLASVYCDAVFHPLLKQDHFKQEGHHLDFSTPGEPTSALTVNGIVYNEMRGVYSDLDGLIDRHTTRSICPDNAYGRDSGGSPDAIPRLTYSAFRDFHARYYHPANARVFLYGNLPTEGHLAFLDERLHDFDRLNVDTRIAPQSRWREPVRETIPYPVGPDDTLDRRAAVVATFLTNGAVDTLQTLGMRLLSAILLDNAASPLRRSLVDSKLGEELTHEGYEDHQRDTFWRVGLKGTRAQDADAILDLILTTCADLVRDGLGKERVARACHQFELAARDISDHYPLHLMDRVYRSWMYDADPFQNLHLQRQLADLRAHLDNEPDFLEQLLDEYVVRNPHYSLLTFVPDPGEASRRDKARAEKMTQTKQAMGLDDLRRLAEEAARLERAQTRPNPPEALATLPRLARSDIPPEPIELGTEVQEVGQRPFLYTDVFANELNYLYVAFDLTGLPDDLVEVLPLYGEALQKMGAADDDYARMAEREAEHTGGIGVSISATGHVEDPYRVHPLFVVHTAGLNRKLDDLLHVFSDRVLRGNLANMDRLADIVLQGRVARRSRLIPAGNHFAAARAARHLTKNAALYERMAGATQILRYDGWAHRFDDARDELADRLTRLQSFLLQRGRVTASYVGAPSTVARLQEWYARFMDELGPSRPTAPPSTFSPRLGAREGLATPTEVAFVAQALPAVGYLDPAAPALQVLSLQLSFGYLWEHVRVRGGAYGAHARYNPLDARLSLTSYRDPTAQTTLQTYAGLARHIERDMDLSTEAVEQAIIGTVKVLDRPVRPGWAAATALARYLHGSTPEHRRAHRSRLLALQGDHLRRAAHEHLAPLLHEAPICVLASRETLNELTRQGPDYDIVDL